MGNANLAKGGMPDFYTPHCNGATQTYSPPYGGQRMKNTPIADAPYDACAPKPFYAASEPLFPFKTPAQYNNLAAAKLTVGDVIHLVLVPTNFGVLGVRFDVADDDPNLIGATVSIVGHKVSVATYDWDTGEVTYTDPVEDPFFAAAAAAQGVTNIRMDLGSSNVVWTQSIVDATFTGNSPTTPGDPIVGAVIGGYVAPYYVAPETKIKTGTPDESIHFQGGGLLLGIKIESMPTEPTVSIIDMQNWCGMSAIIAGFEFKAHS